MNLKTTGLWLIVAASLFAFIFFYQRHARRPETGPPRLLPTLKASEARMVQVFPQGRELEIRVERTNDSWQMTAPLAYPGEATRIEDLLVKLEALTAATSISENELKDRSKADEEYGFAPPQASVIVQPGDHRLRIGRRTAPGDQVFVQIVGVEGIYVVDAELLKAIPQKADSWRETAVIDLNAVPFDRVAVTNGPTIFVLQREGRDALWRMVYPGKDRADNGRIHEALQNLHNLQVASFLPDDPKTDVEALGLQPPQLEIVLAQATNTLASLQFGRSPTNNADLVYARRSAHPALFTVSNAVLTLWRAQARDFRDRRLLDLSSPVDAIEFRGAHPFSVELQGSNIWRVLPQSTLADPMLVQEMIRSLGNLQVVEFVKDFVTDADLPTYGLATPFRQYLLKRTGPSTNHIVAELHFGAVQETNILARRTDESSVYAVRVADLQNVPAAPWQLRDRQIWNVSENDVVRVTIRQHGKLRQLIRHSQHKWSLAPGSQGILDTRGLAEEETLRGLCRLKASAWVAIGAASRPRYGFADDGHQITVELKNGEKLVVEFGGEAPSQFPYAAVQLDGEVWIFEFPLKLYRDVLRCLSIAVGGL